MHSEVMTLYSIEVQRRIQVVVAASIIKRAAHRELEIAIDRAELNLARKWAKMHRTGEKTTQEWHLCDAEFQKNPRFAFTDHTRSIERIWLEAKEAKVAAFEALVVGIVSGVLLAR